MSRHQALRHLDLDEELDDYDGVSDQEGEEELSAEDKEQLDRGLREVRETIGSDVPLTDNEIKESLYYYYYDVPKTVQYLLNKITPKSKSKPKSTIQKPQSSKNVSNFQSDLQIVPTLPPVSDFFFDAPWLNIPAERRGIIVEVASPRRDGLLGGSSQASSAPKSKLAALAAARKRENRESKKEDSLSGAGSILDRLQKSSISSASVTSQGLDGTFENKQQGPRTAPNSKKYAARKRKQSLSPVRQPKVQQMDTNKDEIPAREPSPELKTVPKGSPSSFADVICGISLQSSRPPTNPLLSHFTKAIEETTANYKGFAGPSPDDKVLKAQSSSKVTPTVKKSEKLNPNGVAERLAQGVKDVHINEEKIKSKNIDVAAEYAKIDHKRSANFVVIGHVDAGKSTLMGRLLLDLNVVDQRTIDKYRSQAKQMGKSSFALAWVLDQGTEERARGVTIDVANVKFETATTTFNILDAPGHRDFIPNMIAGASQADFAVLVIDASGSNFESGLRGQTKEHALLVRSIGVQRVVIAINKLDLVEDSQGRFDEISQQLKGFLTKAGFQAKNLSFVACSGLTGENIARQSTDPKISWYKGETLVELLEASEPGARAIQNPLRLTIDDVFKGSLQNPLSISGRLDAGTLQLGDQLLILPASQTATVKGVETDNEPREWAVAGQNVILHLADIDPNYLKAGDIICPVSAPIPLVKSFTVKMLAFQHVMPMPCEIHKGRLHVAARISQLKAELDKGSGTALKGKKKLKIVQPGSVARVVVEVDEALPLESGNRVVLRAEGETVGAGLVE